MRASTALQRHDFDPIAFVFGLVFTGFGVLFMVGGFDLFNHARWLWPGLLVLLGLAVLVGARGRGAQGRERALGAGSAVGTAPAPDAPDLDAIEPPVGPEAFRLPGWPPKASQPAKAAVGSSTDVLEPAEAEQAQATEDEEAEEAPSRPDPHAETEILHEQRPPEPPASG